MDPPGEPMSEPEPTAETVVEVGVPPTPARTGGCSRGSGHGARARGGGGFVIANGTFVEGFASANGTFVTATCKFALVL